MVYRKRKYTRRPVRTYRRKRYVRKMKISRPVGSGEDGKRFFKLRHVVNLQAHTVLEPDIFDDNPLTYPEFGSIATLFDKYRVNAMSIKYVPIVTANSSTATAAFTPGYILHDENHASVSIATSNQFMEYENCKVVNLQRPWKYYRKMKRNIPMEGTGNNLDTKGYQPSSHPVPTQCFAFFQSGFVDDGVQYGTIIVSLYLTATARF